MSNKQTTRPTINVKEDLITNWQRWIRLLNLQ